MEILECCWAAIAVNDDYCLAFTGDSLGVQLGYVAGRARAIVPDVMMTVSSSDLMLLA